MNRLLFLDGLRGLCALYVASTHIYLSHVTEPIAFFQQGRLAVAVFIFLSGYCLSLQKSQAAIAFWRRRAWRILPPYYAAALLAVLVTGLQQALAGITPFQFTTTELAINLLVQNDLSDQLNWSFPFWSIAVECKIYLLVPALRWVEQKGSAIAMLSAAILFAAIVALVNQHVLIMQAPEFIVLFCIGWQAARSRYQLPVWMQKALSIGALRSLGLISYSLYLTHVSTLSLFVLAIRKVPMLFWLNGDDSKGLCFAVELLACVLAAWVFWWLVERHFIRRYSTVP